MSKEPTPYPEAYPDNYQRLFVVTNPVSARAKDIHDTLVAPLKRITLERGLAFTALSTPSADRDESIACIHDSVRTAVQSGDRVRVVMAGGDGMGHLGANAILGVPDDEDELVDNVSIAFAGCGGYNDNATVFMRPHGLLDSLTNRAIPITEAIPMEIGVDGQHLWYSPLYTTIGWTALAADRFNDPAVRGRMRRVPAPLKRSYGNTELVAHFMRTGVDYALPTFECGGRTHEDIGEIMALNSPVAGSVVRTNEAWHETPNHFLASFIDARLAARAQFFGRGRLQYACRPKEDPFAARRTNQRADTPI